MRDKEQRKRRERKEQCGKLVGNKRGSNSIESKNENERKLRILLLVVGEELVSYNPNTQKFKNLGVNSTKDVFSVASYVESLVLIEEGHEVLGEAQKLVDKAEDSDRVTMEGSEYIIQSFADEHFAASLTDL
ncbi:hypothetical protein LguiA_022300 [Lonicera macranthoides]